MFQSSPAVKTIFYLNIGAFLLFTILGFSGINFMPYFEAWNWNSINFMPHQLITYQFLHGGIFHILFNMLAFISLGPMVEDFLGTRKFYIYYLICGVLSAILHIMVVGGNIPLVGASGSVWGIFVMFAMIAPNIKLNIMFIPWGIKAKYLIGVLFLIEVFSCIFTKSDNIAHWGHIGGAITGCLLFIFEKYLLKNRNVAY